MVDSKDVSLPNIETTAAMPAALNPTANLAHELKSVQPAVAITTLENIKIPTIDPRTGRPGIKVDTAGGTQKPEGSVLKIPDNPYQTLDARIESMTDPTAKEADAEAAKQATQQYVDIRSDPRYQQMRAEARTTWNANHPDQQISDEYSATLDKIVDEDFNKKYPDLADAYAEKAQQDAAKPKTTEAPQTTTAGAKPPETSSTPEPVTATLEAAADTPQTPKSPEMQALEAKVNDGTATSAEKRKLYNLQQDESKRQAEQKIIDEREARKKDLDAKLLNKTIKPEEMDELDELTKEKEPEPPKEKTVAEKMDDTIKDIKENGLTIENVIRLSNLQDEAITEVVDRIDNETQEAFLETVRSTPQLLEKIRNPQERDKVQQYINEFAQHSQSRSLYKNAIKKVGEQAKLQLEAFLKADGEYVNAQATGDEKTIQEKALIGAQEASKFRAVDNYYDKLWEAYDDVDKKTNDSREKMLTGLGLAAEKSNLWEKILRWIMEKLKREVKNQLEPHIGKLRKYNLPE